MHAVIASDISEAEAYVIMSTQGSNQKALRTGKSSAHYRSEAKQRLAPSSYRDAIFFSKWPFGMG